MQLGKVENRFLGGKPSTERNHSPFSSNKTHDDDDEDEEAKEEEGGQQQRGRQAVVVKLGSLRLPAQNRQIEIVH